MFTREDYFKNLGFKCDPFESTNSENEEFLNEYFIDPPYFSSLVGSLDHPKTSIVIAPRGFGKTAQRKRLESLSDENNSKSLAIIYDNFPIEGISNPKNITIEMHLHRIMKSILIAFLSKIYIEEYAVEFDAYERSMLLNLIEKYLNRITVNEVTQSINSIKGVKGKLFDTWIKFTKPITSIVNMILLAKSLGTVDLTIERSKLNTGSEFEDFIFIESLYQKIGIKSLFILIDRVDENNLTGNDSASAYELIKPLIRNLNLLERRTIVFKFFLWDKLSDHWSQDIRLDRIENYTLVWQEGQIRNMINKRLRVLSDGKINSLSQIIDSDARTIENIIIFSQNSPRDLINILKSIFDVHINRTKDIDTIPATEDIAKGIDSFCENKFNEVLIDKRQQANIKRIKLSTFTISYLSVNIFKEKESRIRNIIMPWTRSGIVITLPNRVKTSPKKLPVNLYSINDLRIARHVCINQKLEDFTARNIVICNECNSLHVFDKQNMYELKEFNCTNCQALVQL